MTLAERINAAVPIYGVIPLPTHYHLYYIAEAKGNEGDMRVRFTGRRNFDTYLTIGQRERIDKMLTARGL